MGLPCSSSSRVPDPSRLLSAGQTPSCQRELSPLWDSEPIVAPHSLLPLYPRALLLSSCWGFWPPCPMSSHLPLGLEKRKPSPSFCRSQPPDFLPSDLLPGAGAMAESEMQTVLSPALPQPPKRPKRTTVGDSQVIRQHLPSCMPCAHLQVDSWSSVNVGDRRLWPQQQS